MLQDLDAQRLKDITDFLDNIFEEEITAAAYNPAPNSIKKIMESDFEENEKVFMVFMYGLQ